ncbi:MAG: putative metal-binding motif-containing protein [Alphaproteobacteria bacterium]|nr:putative metal-binding motif-containing protein [Alphaproteobacteria bacterium]
MSLYRTPLAILAVAALSACDGLPADGVAFDAVDQQLPTPNTMTLSISPDTAGPGDTLSILISNATPGQRVYLGVTSRGTGSGPCPSNLGGACLDIRTPAQIVFSANPNAAGVITRQVPLPSIPDATYTFQAATFGGTSNTEELVVSSCPLLPWYADADADGFGTGAATMACTQPTGFADNDEDCDDTNSAINPTAPESIGNGIDDDCDVGVDEFTFTQIYNNVIQPNCSCHSGSSHPTNFFFNNSQATAYANLVNRAASQASIDIVEPFFPDDSYLHHKLAGTQASVGGSGLQMPRGGTPLSLSTRNSIDAWILSGAPND